MNRMAILAGAALLAASVGAGAAHAQGAPQNVQLVRVDVTTLASGYRASKVIGSDVVNDVDDKIGAIDDLLVSPDGKRPFAVLSVGGFLGMGTRYVVVPYESLVFGKDKIILPGGSVDGLKTLPEFNYATD